MTLKRFVTAVVIFGAGALLAQQIPAVWAYVLGYGAGIGWAVFSLVADDKDVGPEAGK